MKLQRSWAGSVAVVALVLAVIGVPVPAASSAPHPASSAAANEVDPCTLLTVEVIQATLGVSTIRNPQDPSRFPKPGGQADQVGCGFFDPVALPSGQQALVGVFVQPLRAQDVTVATKTVRTAGSKRVKHLGRVASLDPAVETKSANGRSVRGARLAALVGRTLLDVYVQAIFTDANTTAVPTDAQVIALGREVARNLTASTSTTTTTR